MQARFRGLQILSIGLLLLGSALPGEAQVNADFTFSPANPAVGQAVQFTDTSTGNPVAWEWDFEDPPNGTDSTIQNPTWVFQAPGTYTVRLVASVPPLDIDIVVKEVVVVEDFLFGDDFEAGNICAWNDQSLCGPMLRFTSSAFAASEGEPEAEITVERYLSSEGSISVRCETANGTAIAGSDYLATMDTLSWADGESGNKICTVTLLDDTVIEADETLILSLTNPTGGAMLGSPSSAVLTLEDNDEASELSFSFSSYAVDEGTGTASITVRRLNGSSGTVSVRCDTSDGTATAGDDYTATMEMLTWVDGDTADKICTVPILDDADNEFDETINLALTSLSGAVTGANPTAVLTINANDTKTLSFTSGTYMVDEDAGTIDIDVQRTGDPSGMVTAQCETVIGGSATAGADYTATTEMLTWADGVTRNQTCTIPITDDTDEENDETINLALTSLSGAVTGANPTAVLTINANDPAMKSFPTFTDTTQEVWEDGFEITVTIQRDEAGAAASVRCVTRDDSAVAEEDYLASSTVLEWAAGETGERTCTVSILEDSLGEIDEALRLELVSLADGRTVDTATVTIRDNEPSRVAFAEDAYSADENLETGIATVDVLRTGDSSGAISIRCDSREGEAREGTAAVGADYEAVLETLEWQDGESGARACEITLLDDDTMEGGESLELELTNPVGTTIGARNRATLSLVDNEYAGDLSFAEQAPEVSAAGVMSVEILRTGGSAGKVSALCEITRGTAWPGSDFEAGASVLSWADGDTTPKTCKIRLLDGAEPSGHGSLSLRLRSLEGGATIRSPATTFEPEH